MAASVSSSVDVATCSPLRVNSLSNDDPLDSSGSTNDNNMFDDVTPALPSQALLLWEAKGRVGRPVGGAGGG